MARLYKNNDNEVNVNANKIAETFNRNIFGTPIITYHFFENKTIAQGEKIIYEILWMSIQNRINMLKSEVAKNIFRDIMVQCLDFQWTNHLDKITKVREGVQLRSLEQRSPLNIYVEEADWNFNEMKKNVAHQVIISIHRIYIPKVNDQLREELKKILPQLNLTADALVDNPKVDDAKIEEIFAQKPNLKVNTNPKLPKDAPKPSSSNAKEELLKKVFAKKQEQTKK